MNDWEQFVDEVCWFVEPGQPVTQGQTRPWNRGTVDGLPQLSALLARAALTAVTVGDQPYELLAWGPAESRRGWLCHPPVADALTVVPAHAAFWRVCGGIVERFGEPETWWMNHEEVLTASAAQFEFNDMLDAYSWAWKQEGLEMSIDSGDYYVAGIEANGNLTLVRRDDGSLLLFAPDHDFSGVTRFPGSPDQSLYTIDGVPDVATWIEVCAARWRAD